MQYADALIAVSNVIYLSAALSKDIRVLRILSIGGASFSIAYFLEAGRVSGILCGILWISIHAVWLFVLVRRHGFGPLHSEKTPE